MQVPGTTLKTLVALMAVALLLPCAAALADPLPPHTARSADLVVVLKADRLMYVYRDGLPIHRYHIQLGGNPIGGKRQEGDERTPEGAYVLDWRNPHSHFYRSIHISYPGPKDSRLAALRGVRAGENIMIHGQPSYDNKPRTGDWTNGCIAVSDKAMDQLWQLVGADTPIHIYP